MLYGFIDESGTPGVASCNRDCLLASLVVFETPEECARATRKIEDLRQALRLPDDYEFHCSSNSTRPQAEFLKLLSSLNFRFVTVAIHKNDFKKTASYARLANLLINETTTRLPEMRIEMDSNPILYAELRKCIRAQKLKNLKIRERNSRSNRLIQVADYVVNISAKKVKNTPKAREWYGLIAKKVLGFIEIAD